jgi:hypothetical protein
MSTCVARIAAAIPGARLVAVRDCGHFAYLCGHFAYLERPDEVRSALGTFLGAS